MIPLLRTFTMTRRGKPRASGDDPQKIIDHYYYNE